MSKEKPPEMETQIVTAFAPPPPNLRQKLAKARAELKFIEKRGHNQFHNYDYVQAADVQGTVGLALAKVGVIIAMRNVEIEYSDATTQKGGHENVVRWRCDYGFIDGDSDEQLWYPAFGEGRDAGDKAVYKARTGAMKYFISQGLCLGMGDDPEETGGEEHEHGSKPDPSTRRTPFQKAVIDAPKMTPEQSFEIDQLLMQSSDPDATAQGLLKHFNVVELKDLTTLNANVAITTLKTKLAKAKEAANGNV